MSKCPNCSEPISAILSKEGGTCPRCAHFILASSTDFELEPSDTQEKIIETSSGFDSTELEMITYEETEEYEPTELIRRIPTMSKGSVADDSYQEDFPDEDFLEEDDFIVVDAPKEEKNNSSLGIIIVLLGITGILGGYLYTLKNQPQTTTSGFERHSETYNTDNAQFIDPAEVARKKKEEEERIERERIEAQKKKLVRKKVIEQEVVLEDKIENLLDMFLNTFSECVDRETVKNPDFDSTISYKITIDTSGSVINPAITVKGDSTEKFQKCLNRAVKNWQFPKREKAVTIRRTF